MTQKPRLFIGSSTPGREVAEAIAERLKDVAVPRPWYKVFELTKANVEQLDKIADDVEFAVLVLTADDTRDRGNAQQALVPRDNVIFELGFFMGKLGRQRTFAIKPAEPRIDLPTDLDGVQIPNFRYVGPNVGTNVVLSQAHKKDILEAVRDSVRSLKDAIKRAPSFRRAPSDEVTKVYPQRRYVATADWRAFIKSANNSLWLYGMAESGYARDDSTLTTFKNVPECCDVRLLLLDPESPHVAEIDKNEGANPGTLKQNILTALEKFSLMQRSTQRTGIKIRVYSSYPQISIVRADNRALVTTYVRPLAGDDSPTLELCFHDDRGEGLWGGYQKNFDHVWEFARDWP